MSNVDKMLGRKHGPQCDCNSKYVAGTDGKCNKKYGVSRQRTREKSSWKKEARESL